ncbi:MAG: cytochrome c3 family protein [Deltaproteobacteria bacterium]|nr:cytochrome c3 family protein [Deltaproteobacteria bacterium]
MFLTEHAAPRLVTTGLAFVTILLALSVGLGARNTGPKQPIENFSHRIHAGVNQIECLHCHAGTGRSQLAGVPAVSVCMGCHQYMTASLEKPGVKQLFEYWEKKEPIPWARVYYLPQYAQFKHEAHIRAEIACQTCHGPVQEMDVISLNQPLQMNWCINCHKNTAGAAKIASAPTDCTTCHY